MTIPDAHLLLAMRRADARIHVEHDTARRPSIVSLSGECAFIALLKRMTPLRNEKTTGAVAYAVVKCGSFLGAYTASWPVKGPAVIRTGAPRRSPGG